MKLSGLTTAPPGANWRMNFTANAPGGLSDRGDQFYVQAKGKTFFNNDVFFDTGLSTDSVVNATLEQLRQLAEHGIQSNNETLAEQAMTGMAETKPKAD